MALQLGNDFLNIFNISAEDGQVLTSQGSRYIPGDVIGTTYEINDEFTTAELDPIIWDTSIDAGGSITTSAGELTLRRTTGDFTSMYSRRNWNLTDTNKIIFETKFKPVIIAGDPDYTQISIGLTGDPTTNLPTDWSVIIKFEDSGDTTSYSLYNKKNGTGTSVGPGTISNNVYHTLKLILTSTNIEAWIDGALAGTNASNIPDDLPLYVHASIYTVNAGQNDLILDYIKVKIE